MAITGGSDFGWLNVAINTSDLDRLVQSVLSPTAIKRIQSRAINETTSWIRSRLLRDLPSATGIPRMVLATRIKPRKASANLATIITGKVWLGMNPVDAMKLGDDGYETGTGYASGDFYFEGGFEAMNAPHKDRSGIFARVDGSGKRSTTSWRGVKRLSQPIKRQNVRIDNFANEVVRRLIPQAERELARRTERLMGYELEKAAR